MNNTELMNLLKQVNTNNVQKKYLYIMGGIVLATGIGLYFLAEKSKRNATDLKACKELNNDLVATTKKQYAALLQNESLIQKLTGDNQGLQKIIALKEDSNPLQ